MHPIAQCVGGEQVRRSLYRGNIERDFGPVVKGLLDIAKVRHRPRSTENEGVNIGRERMV